MVQDAVEILVKGKKLTATDAVGIMVGPSADAALGEEQL
jgi:hypothetical protein